MNQLSKGPLQDNSEQALVDVETNVKQREVVLSNIGVNAPLGYSDTSHIYGMVT
jgi:hypothetical protein